MPKKIIFLGSKPIGFQCLSHLIAERNTLDFEVSGILTQPRREFGNDHDLGALANQHNIPVLNSVQEITEIDILYSVQYHEILKESIISKARQIAVNLHMAPLPEYRGSNQFSYAIIEDKKEFGTTIHQMDDRIDHGDILFQQRFSIPENCWVNHLYKLTYDASLELFKNTLPNIINEKYESVSQDSLTQKYGTSLHYRTEIAELKKIDLNWDKEKIQRHIRATYMPGFEPPYCIIDGEKLYFSTQYQ
jgi:methionyl-tRNA formyltransferase